jgi:MFS family permease
MSRRLALLFLASFGGLTSFALLLSVVPLYATTVGASGVGAGLTTGVLMLATAATELATPRLLDRFGYRAVFAVGLLLVGAPTLALPLAGNLPGILAICLIRGAGFAVVVVVGSALVAVLVPRERRGEGIGVYGIVVGIPVVVATPLGVWLVGRTGYAPVFVAGALTALIGLLAVPGLPGRSRPAQPDPDADPPLGILAGLRSPALLRPAIVFASTTMAGGIVVTFLPLAVPGGQANLAAAALLVHALTATGSRWWAGRFGDRHGPDRLLVPSVLTSAIGVLGLVFIDNAAAVLVAVFVFGLGYGVIQNVSLTLMFERVPHSSYGTASAVWNLAFDAGLGLGAAGFGVVATQTGYPVSFGLTSALILVILLASHARRHVTAWRGGS